MEHMDSISQMLEVYLCRAQYLQPYTTRNPQTCEKSSQLRLERNQKKYQLQQKQLERLPKNGKNINCTEN